MSDSKSPPNQRSNKPPRRIPPPLKRTPPQLPSRTDADQKDGVFRGSIVREESTMITSLDDIERARMARSGSWDLNTPTKARRIT